MYSCHTPLTSVRVQSTGRTEHTNSWVFRAQATRNACQCSYKEKGDCHVSANFPKNPSTTNSWENVASVGLQKIGRSDFKRRFGRMRMRKKTLQLMPTSPTRPKPGVYTGCPRRNVKYFGRVFLMLNYTDITQNTYIQS